MRVIIGLLLCMAAWAGQSLQLGFNTTTATNTAFPARCASDWRAEGYVHDWPNTPSVRLMQISAVNLELTWSSGTTLRSNSGLTGGTSQMDLSIVNAFAVKQLYFRYQFTAATFTTTGEIWDATGARIASQSYTGTGYSGCVNGVTLGNYQAADPATALAFLRIHSTTVALNSRPPVTFDNTARLIEWKFDLSLNDALGVYNLTQGSGGAAVYISPTPGQGVIAKAQTLVRPTWSDQQSLRAGTANSLDGSSSYSQSDTSNSVTYQWALLSGPTPPTWSSRTASQPSLTGLVFGPYQFGLTATDITGTTATATLDVGAVATDNNGVVIQGNAAADALFGPMIAFGKNPWGYQDDTALRGMTLRSAVYATAPYLPMWKTLKTGTVSYSADVGVQKATLASPGITATDTTLTLNTLNLGLPHTVDLTTFPLVITIGGYPGGGTSSELIHICSAVGNVLTVCFNGRGWKDTTAAAHSTSDYVYQNKATGSGTAFMSEFCPAGVGGTGTIAYSTGTVSVTPGSAVVNGNGVAWPTAAEGYRFYKIRIQGTYSSGTPFVFQSSIPTANAATQLTMARAWPSAADTGATLTYQILLDNRQFAPKWARPDATIGQTAYSAGACMSDTALYFEGGTGTVTGAQVAQPYSWYTTYWISAGGVGTINFYDEVLANYALYLRSGYGPALTAARAVGDNWLSYPALDDGYYGQFPRNMSIAGPVAAAVLDGRTQNWYGLRRLATQGVTAISTACDSRDLRENAYQLMWLSFAAQFDPDISSTNAPGGIPYKTYWVNQLANAYTADAACKRSDNSFASGQATFNGLGPLTLTNGSTAVAGTGFTAATCNRTAGGAGTISANGDVLTVSSGVPSGAKILIAGTKGGVPYNAYFQFSGTTSVALSGQWPGDTGSVTWQSESDSNITTWSEIATVNPTYPGKVYGCTYNSSTSLTLNRVWAEGSTTIGTLSRGNLSGYGTQPFILGIKVLQMKQAANGATGATATNYLSLANAAAVWILGTGYDPVTKGMYYGRVFDMCEPIFVQGSSSAFTDKNVGCSYAATNQGTARPLLAEAQNAVRIAYEASPTAPNLATGDAFYGAQWGKAGYTTAGYTGDDGVQNYFALDQQIAAGKWLGFQFGVGMSHQWPAVRVGGVTPKTTTAKPIQARLADVTGATDIVVDYLAADSSVSTSSACTSAACTFATDDRQSYQYRVRYRNSGGANLAVGEYAPVR